MIGLEVIEQRLGFVKREDVAGLRIRIEAIRELRFDAGGFIGEWQRFAPFRVNVEQTLAVLAGLFFDTREGEALRLRFNCADGFAVNEEKIVGFVATLQERFTNGDSTRSREIDRGAVL